MLQQSLKAYDRHLFLSVIYMYVVCGRPGQAHTQESVTMTVTFDVEDLNGGKITCFKCSPGYKFISNCLQNNTQAKCTACESGTYESYPNISPYCSPCSSYCPERFNLISTCNATMDNTCECQTGTYYTHPGLCLYHTNCKHGEMVKSQGNKYKNRECEPCPNGTFSTSLNCMTCQKCGSCLEGQTVSVPCTSTTNTVCKENEDTHAVSTTITADRDSGVLPSWGIGVISAVAVSFVIVIGGVTCIYCRRHCMRHCRRHCPSKSSNCRPRRPSDTSRSDTHQVSDKMIDFLSRKIKPKMKNSFFIDLIPEVTGRGSYQLIQQVEHDCQNDVIEQNRKLFQWWKEKLGSKATVESISNSLVAADMKDVAEGFNNRFNFEYSLCNEVSV